MSGQSHVSLQALRLERDQFADFVYNRNLFSHEAALKQTKAKFKATEATFAPAIDQKSHSMALKQAI